MSKLTKEQLEVINHTNGNILVSASAGSGKTHTMIERIKRLIIKEGVGISNILAVTFTESAAADMKQKMRNALNKVALGELDNEITAQQKKACIEQIPDISTADICTMHAFCGRIIRSYFFTVGLSPDFKILDEADANILRISSVEKTFAEFYESNKDWFLSLVDRHSSNRMDDNLKSLILSAYAFFDSESNPKTLIEKSAEIYTEEFIDQLLDRYKQILNKRLSLLKADAISALQLFTLEGLVKACNFTQTLIGDIDAVISAKDIYSIKWYENYKLRLDFERNLSESAKEQKEIVSAVRKGFTDLIARFSKCVGANREEDLARAVACKEHSQKLNIILNRFAEIYAQEKREENALDFNDLEHFALKILSDESVAKEVRERYKYIFVDEYQDTNGVQEEIIAKIANDNVFMVGDVKQSIYGFRGCRADFFIEKDKNMTASGQKVVRLNHNFRSTDSVINMVNGIFNYCMTDSVYGESYKEKAQLVKGGLYPENYSGRAVLHYLQKEKEEKTPEEKPRIYDILQEKPQDKKDDTDTLASLISTIIFEERSKTFYDTKTEEHRPVSFGDIAILTRNRSSKYVSDLVSGLIANGIPVSSDVNENVCDFPEVKVMINALKLIDCFKQDLPLVSTLKSAIGNFSEEELLSIVRFYEDNAQNCYGGFFDAFEFYLNNANTPLQQKLSAFNNYFEKIRLSADFVGAHGALNKLIEDSAFEAHLYAQPNGANMVDRLRKFVSVAVVSGKILTVKEFLLRVETCPEAFGLSPFASENTVKVMTIHASKGLEFPVVITCGLERTFNTDDDYGDVLFSRNYGYAISYYDDQKRSKGETLLRGIIREEKRLERIKEEMRLFYVAATRATNALHLTFWSKNDLRREEFHGADKFLDFIPSYMGSVTHTDVELEFKRVLASKKDVIIINPDKEIVAQMQKDFLAEYPFKADCTVPLKASVTAVSKTEVDDESAPIIYSLFNEESPSAESGTAAHRILECFDFDGEDDISSQVNGMINNGLISKEDASLVNLERLNQALNNDAFSRIKGKKLYREKGFLVNVPASLIFETESDAPVLIQGVIDLLVVDGDTAEIIDYKYSSLSNESLKKKYKKQLDLYAYAVEKITGKKVLRKTLVNIFYGYGESV